MARRAGASAARGVPSRLQSLDLRANKIDSLGVTALCKAVENGAMESLCWIDLSENYFASNKL